MLVLDPPFTVSKEFVQGHIASCPTCSSQDLAISEIALRTIALIIETQNLNDSIGETTLSRTVSRVADSLELEDVASDLESQKLSATKQALHQKIQELEAIQQILPEKEFAQCEAIANHIIDPFDTFDTYSDVEEANTAPSIFPRRQ